MRPTFSPVAPAAGEGYERHRQLYIQPMTDEPIEPPRVLTPAARRALAEAEARRTARAQAEMAVEHGGPTGPEPTRYGDWEKKGLAVDF